MLREISEEVRVNLKDRLRDVRQIIRNHRHDGTASLSFTAEKNKTSPFPFREIEGLMGHAVSAFDDAMTVAQTLIPHERHDGIGTAKCFGSYFPSAHNKSSLSGERLFRRDMYHLAKAALAKTKAKDSPVYEASFASVHASMLKHHGVFLKALDVETEETERLTLAAQLCAGLLMEFLAQRPLRIDASIEAHAEPADLVKSREILCFAPIVLACGLASVCTSDAPEIDVFDIATLAVEARQERILAACSGADPMAELTPIFAMLLFHLR